MWPWACKADREEIAIAEARADRGGLAGDRGGSFEVTCSLVTENERDQQVAMLRSVVWSVLEQPLGAPEPAARRAYRTPVGEVHADPGRGTHRAQRLASLEIPVVGTLEDPDRVVVSTEHQRRRRQ